MHRIVIVGGGAGGLELATRLGNKYRGSDRASVTLAERARTHIWKPLLHSLAAGSLDPSQHELNYLAQAHWHGFTHAYGEMTGLDRAAREILLAATHDEEGREITPARRVGYDTLVMAVGSVTNDFGTPGASRYAIPLETAEQASRFNRRLINACLHANAQEGPIRPGQLHVAIIGAGATGTELAAELHRTVRSIVAYGLDRIQPERDIRIILLEAAPRILPGLPERISEATLKLLREMGVEVRTGTRVSEVREEGILLADGTFVPAELTVWAAGVKGPDFLRELDGLETNRVNQLVVLPTLQATRDPAVFAIGDCAACPLPDGKGQVPPRAQSAHQMASHMVGQVERILEGKPLEPFVYRDFGSLVSLGEYSTVGNLMGALTGRSFFIEGWFARLMYRSLYQMHLAALHGKAPTLWRYWLSLFSQRPEPTVKLH
ncbi:NAD(P)/FAD-dependent oxidoreductase [Roseococcus sp. YIM B11640]|uniref:NAD(P)/FAD-dependent oxidoreductase n=1 Tax=Roseococcus sp. YIM B11640 TaxID=3133973 RepID=UPI003C7AB1C7